MRLATRLTIPVTGVALGLGRAFRSEGWLRHLIVANALIGTVYMYRERAVLMEKGGVFLGMRVNIALLQNMLLNVFSHVFLTMYVLSRLRHSREHEYRQLGKLLGTYGACLVLIDIDRVYPVHRGSVYDAYIPLHLLATMASVCAFRQTSQSNDSELRPRPTRASKDCAGFR